MATSSSTYDFNNPDDTDVNSSFYKFYQHLQYLKQLSRYESEEWRKPRYWLTFRNSPDNLNNHSLYNGRNRQGRSNFTGHVATPHVNHSGQSSSSTSLIVRESARKWREALAKSYYCSWSSAVLVLEVPHKLFKPVTNSLNTTVPSNNIASNSGNVGGASVTTSTGTRGRNTSNNSNNSNSNSNSNNNTSYNSSRKVLSISLWLNIVSTPTDARSDEEKSNINCNGQVYNETNIQDSNKNTSTGESNVSNNTKRIALQNIAPDEVHLYSLTHGNIVFEVWLNVKSDRFKFRLLCSKYWLVLIETEEAIDQVNQVRCTGESINYSSRGTFSTTNASVKSSTYSKSSKCASKLLTRLPIDKWHHVSISIAFGKQERKEGLISVSIIVNGLPRSITKLENFNDEFNPLTSTSDVLFLLGTNFLPKYISSLQMTSLKLLTDKLNRIDCTFLYLLGPNDETITTSWNEKVLSSTLQLPFQLPISIDADICYQFVSTFTDELNQRSFISKLISHSLIEFPILKREFNVMKNVSIKDRVKCLAYIPSNNSLQIPSVSRIQVLLLSSTSRNDVFDSENDYHCKLNDSMSIDSLLFVTGKLLESSSSTATIQSEVLHTFFKLIECNSQFYKSFCSSSGYLMINEALKGIRCNNPQLLLKVYFDHCVLMMNDNNNLLIRHSIALISCFKCWRLWYTSADSISYLYTQLLSLFDINNIWCNINVTMIQQSTLLDEILCMLQVSFIEKSTLPTFTFNGIHVTLLGQIIVNVIGTPPNLQLLRKLVNCLVLLHDSNRAYVSSSRQSFYFLLPHHLFTLDEENKCESTSDSGLSCDGWQVIRTTGDITSNETIHTLIFSGLIKCLIQILGNLTNDQFESVLGPIIKVEHLIVWSNFDNTTVREVVLLMLTTCLRRSGANEFIHQFDLKGGFPILSNQLSQYSVTPETISILSNFILDTEAVDFISNDEWINSRNWNRLTRLQASAFTCMMSQILKSVDETSTCHWALLIFTRLLSCIPFACPTLKYLMDHGLVNFCANIIYHLTHKLSLNENNSNEVKCSDILLDHDVISKDINCILEIIAFKLISSTGNVFYEAFDSAVNLFIILSKMKCVDTNLFRDALISLLKGALDAIEKYSSLLSDKSSFRDYVNAISSVISFEFYETLAVDSTLNSANNHSHHNNKTSSVQSGLLGNLETTLGENETSLTNVLLTDNGQSNHVNLSRSELNQRSRHLLDRSVEAIGLRDAGAICSEEERYFCRSLLHTLFKKSICNDSRDMTKWLFLNSTKRSIRSKLASLLLFTLSPLYTLDERVKFADWISSNLYDFTSYLSQKQMQTVQAFAKRIIIHCHTNDANQLDDISFDSSNTLASAIERAFIRDGSCNVKQLTDFDEIKWLQSECKNNEPIISKYIQKINMCNMNYETNAQQLIEIAMKITQTFVADQNIERNTFFSLSKDESSNVYMCKKKWKSIVKCLTHEENVYDCFYDENFFPQSWSLDPTEGPSRMRRKLKRCHLDIPSRFFRTGYQYKSRTSPVIPPLASILSTNDATSETSMLIDLAHLNEQMRLTSVVSMITPQSEYQGELLLSETCVHFIGRCEQATSEVMNITIKETWYLTEILEYLEQRYQLQDVALEIFLENGNSYLLAFKSSDERKTVVNFLYTHGLSQTTELKSLSRITKLWRDNQLTNFDYLMFLNKLAGRSFNDLMIYPVYPFVLSDYRSESIDLSDEKYFRNLSKPMSIQQGKEKEKHYRDQYSYLLSEYKRRLNESADGTSLDPVSCPVYHYGSHYSNSGTVLHFLVRLPPYTQMFLQYQDMSFDIPDRAFHSMQISWDLASGLSPTDFKELTPEFFYLPEFMVNFEHFDLGVRQTGVSVEDVVLPNWCRKNARLFVLINRQALESDIVSRHLHQWIDLIFGYKQSGPASVDAINVFHPATYYGLEVNKITDPLKQNALLTMIRTFGQMPKQLFKHPHPQISQNTNGNVLPKNSPHINCEVGSLKWGTFVGSPTEPDPMVVFKSKESPLKGSLIALKTEDIFALPSQSCLLVAYNTFKRAVNSTFVSSLAVLSWSDHDGLIRVRDRRGRTSAPFTCTPLDGVSMCATLSSYELLFVAYVSGKIAVYSVRPPFDLTHGLKSCEKPITHLYGHKSSVTSMVLNREFRIAVSGDTDGKCILWDLNSLEYVRRLNDRVAPSSHENAIISIAISPTLGDIATVSTDNRISKSRLFVVTVNDCPVGDVETDVPIHCLCYSSCPEGVSINVLVTGFADGTVQMWSSWDLTPVRKLFDPTYTKPITSLCFFSKCDYLCVLNSDGDLRIYGKTGRPPVTSNPVTIL